MKPWASFLLTFGLMGIVAAMGLSFIMDPASNSVRILVGISVVSVVLGFLLTIRNPRASYRRWPGQDD